MKIVFFGTPAYVVPILEALHKKYNRGHERELIAVVTQSPKPVGRDQKIEYSAVDTFAHAHKIDICFEADEIPQADLGICAAYGKIIPQHVINQFSQGILNIHPSLLPQFRGASPIQGTILSGKAETGVTIIKMDEELDHGPIVSSFKSQILPDDTNETLRARLFEESVDFLMELIPSYLGGKIKLKLQKHESATYTKPILKEDGYIAGEFISQALKGKVTPEPWSVRFVKDLTLTASANVIEQYIRAITPWPGAFTLININHEQKRLKLLKAHAEDSVLVLDQVQMEGKNPVTWKQFIEGYPSFTFKKS